MAELNLPTHRWYQGKNHVRLARDDFSKQYIYESGLRKIDDHVLKQDGYAISGESPNFLADFKADRYYADTIQSNFLQAIDHSATSNATMTGDYGPELVTNGDFSQGDTGWTVSGSDSTHYITFANGTARYVSDTTSPVLNLSQSVGLEVGKTYEVVIKVLEIVSGSLKTDSFGGSYTIPAEVGVHRFVRTASSTSFQVYRNSSNVDITIDNISVREAPKIQWRPHNLLKYSEDFSASAWSKTATTVTANAAVAPDGTQTADKISHTGTIAQITQAATSTDGVSYTVGIYVKYVDHQWFRIFADIGSVWFDIQNGVVGSTSASLTGTLTDIGSGWYYLTIEDITASGASFNVIPLLASADLSTVETVGTSAYIWGAHLYRSDLGGMADVPADARVIPTATKYVRTAGRVIGSELISSTAQSGTITQTASSEGEPWWTAEGTGQWSISSNALTRSAGGTWESLRRDLGMEVNKTYRLTFDLVVNAGSVSVYRDYGAVMLVASQTGSYEVDFTPVGANASKIQFSSANLDGTISNISVKEIDVNPAQARYLPRRGHHAYNGSQWVNKGLLHESEARTNFIDESEASGLGVVRATTTAGSSVWIDGSSTMVKVVENTDTNSHAAYENPVGTFADNTVYTFSTYLKAGERSWAKLGIKKKTSAIAGAWFDLSGGVVGTIEAGASSATIEDCGNGIYRCSVSVDLETGANAQQTFIYTAIADNSLSYTGDGSSGLECYGLQFELGSTPSSYIPTSGSTVTRAAETLTIPAANLPWPSPVYVTNTELVTNGTFDTDSDWTKTGATTISGGKANLDGTSGTGLLYQDILVQGRVYQASFDIDSISGTMTVIANDGTTLGTYTTSGSKSLVFVNSIVSGNFLFRVSTGSNTATIDNISVKEINPLALSIQMSGEMTYADTGGFPEVYLIQWYANSSNNIDAFIGANLGTGQFRVRQNDGGTLDQSIQADIDYFTPGINVPFNISSRHGSTFINGAVDGVALTEDTTPVGLPDLSSIDLNLGYDFMGTIDTFRVWAEDIGNTGIAEATEPSEDATLFLSFDGTETSYIDFEWSE